MPQIVSTLSFIHFILIRRPDMLTMYFPVFSIIPSSEYASIPLFPSKIISLIPVISILTPSRAAGFVLSFLPIISLPGKAYALIFVKITTYNSLGDDMSAVVKLRARDFVSGGLILAAVIIMLVFSKNSAEGAKRGLVSAAEYLVPSLFPFMVVSSFTMKSRSSRVFRKALYPVTKYLLRLPDCCGTAVFFSLAGGFPVGARCVSLLKRQKQISDKTAERMMCYCVCPGPAFLITAVGALMLRSPVSGLILYISQVISSLIIGAVTGALCKKNDTVTKEEKSQTEYPGFCENLISSASDAAYSVLELVSLVVLFSVITELAGFFTHSGALSMLLEVTSGCNYAAQHGSLSQVALVSGFGGICVHMQIFHILKDIKISRIRFFVFRIINCVLSSLITYIICLFYSPVQATAALPGGAQYSMSAVSFAGSVSIVIMCIVFVLSVSSRTRLYGKLSIRR